MGVLEKSNLVVVELERYLVFFEILKSYCLMYFLFFLLVVFCACQPTVSESSSTPSKLTIDSSDTSNQVDTLTPIWGYRFVIEGDFNGDGQQDTLVEHFKNKISNKETHKFYEEVEYDLDYQYYNYDKRQVYTTLESTNGKVLPLIRGFILGFSWLETIGDVDNNGTDEIGFVFNNADASNLNHYYIYTLRDSGWVELHSFGIREFNFPPLPDHFIHYGLFGPMDAQPVEDSSLQEQLIALIDTFQYVKLVAPYTIQYQTADYIPCETFFQLDASLPITPNTVWIKPVVSIASSPIKSVVYQLEIGDYQKETQTEILKELQTGQYEECDPGMEYLTQVIFEQQ